MVGHAQTSPSLLNLIDPPPDLINERHDQRLDVGDLDLEEGGVLDMEAAAAGTGRAIAEMIDKVPAPTASWVAISSCRRAW